jgi:hypothetical protein
MLALVWHIYPVSPKKRIASLGAGLRSTREADCLYSSGILGIISLAVVSGAQVKKQALPFGREIAFARLRKARHAEEGRLHIEDTENSPEVEKRYSNDAERE